MRAGIRRRPSRCNIGKSPATKPAFNPLALYDAPYYRGSGKLQGKVALITGADSGIGPAVAVLCARESAQIAIQYLSEYEDALRTQQAVRAEGRPAILLSGDVRSVVRAFGRLDVLVNNVAFQLHTRRIEDLTEEHFDLTLRTNLHGYFFMAQAALPTLDRAVPSQTLGP